MSASAPHAAPGGSVPAPAATAAAPRIEPGTAAEIGRVNLLITRVLGAATGGGPPNLFTTLARHPRLFRRWLRFAAALMPGGLLPRADTELVILRVAHNTSCEYEWRHHERLAPLVGLSREDVQRVGSGPAAPEWPERQRLLLRAADELHTARVISDGLWSELSPLLSDAELIELVMLVGHYEMLAAAIGSLRIAADPVPSDSLRGVARLIQGAALRRARKAR